MATAATISRAVVSAAAELMVNVERAMVGEDRIRTARGNAWDAICADRARAQARAEMNDLVRALLANGRRAGVDPAAAVGSVPAGTMAAGSAPAGTMAAGTAHHGSATDGALAGASSASR